MGAKQLTLYRGDDKVYDVTVKDSDGNVVDITGYTVKFTVKRNPSDAVGLISKSTGGLGISLVNPTQGVARITLTDSDTALTPDRYLYDVEVTDTAGRTSTVIVDYFIVKNDITR